VVRGSSFDDPAVQAGFAAAYDGDPWSESTGPLGLPGFASQPPAEPVSQAPPSPVQGELDVDRQPARDPLTSALPADPTTGTGSPDDPVAPVLPRPPRPTPRRRAAPPGTISPGRALAGAAVSVGGVALGILSLLWVTGDAATPADVAARTAVPTAQSAPTVQSAPVEDEQPPVDPPPAPEPPDAPPVAGAAPPVPEQAPPAPPPAAAPAAPPLAPITVLNNSRTTGLADRAAASFRDGGWPVAETGNFTGRIQATTVYFAPGQEESARAFADRFPGVERVLPRFDGLPGTGLTVVLTRDFA
jgi:hypothetical protein